VSARRTSARRTCRTSERFAGAAAAAGSVAVIAALVALLPTRQPANAATVALPPARAAALVAATSGAAATELQAVGEQAKLINAALPFAGGPVQSAKPFALTGGTTDERRALLCLTQAIYYEAGFEPLEGRRAVAQVVLNRMRHSAFPKSVCGVVYQRSGSVCQFTFVCDGSLYRPPALGGWRQAEAIARSALDGFVERSVGGATHYHADYVAPRWAPLLAKVAKLGQHIFYRWPGAWGKPAAFTGKYIGEPRDPLSMRPPVVANQPLADEAAAAPGAVTDGTVLKRAPNDVGGLLDTSKGWTLHIPGPDESASGAASLLAAPRTKPATALDVPSADSSAPVVASR